MQSVVAYLKENPTFFLATIDGDQPRVRPFGAIAVYEGRLYICTNSQKPCFHQMRENPKVELCAVDGKGGWLRVAATAVRDTSAGAKARMLAENPGLSGMYGDDSPVFEVLYLKDAEATFASFGTVPETIRF